MLIILRGQRLSGYQKRGRTCSLSFRFEGSLSDKPSLLKERWLIRASTASKFSVYYKNIYMSKGSSIESNMITSFIPHQKLLMCW